MGTLCLGPLRMPPELGLQAATGAPGEWCTPSRAGQSDTSSCRTRRAVCPWRLRVPVSTEGGWRRGGDRCREALLSSASEHCDGKVLASLCHKIQ